MLRMKLGLVLLAMLIRSGAVLAVCGGDCSGDGEVTVNEVVLGVNIALGSAALSQCTAFDSDHDGEVTVNEVIGAVSNALNGCPVPVPTATATATATVHLVPTPTPTAATVPPGISTLLLGTFSGHAKNDNTHVDLAARFKIEVVSGKVVITDLNRNVFANGTSITVTVIAAPTVIAFNSFSNGAVEVLQLALVPTSTTTLGGTYSKSPISNPTDQTHVFALILTREP